MMTLLIALMALPFVLGCTTLALVTTMYVAGAVFVAGRTVICLAVPKWRAK